jgi:hypothetical protein
MSDTGKSDTDIIVEVLRAEAAAYWCIDGTPLSLGDTLWRIASEIERRTGVRDDERDAMFASLDPRGPLGQD